MRVLVSPTAFKGTLTPSQAAQSISDGIRRADPLIDVVVCPIADGGDGTAEVLVDALGGFFTDHDVTGPLGDPVTARVGWHKQTAIVEMAAASGLVLIPDDRLEPLRATSFGTGELIVEAMRLGAKEVVLGVGGSASSDAGAGIAQALGIKLMSEQRQPIDWGAEALMNLEWIERAMPEVRLVIACDVENPLVGPEGSARVFSPQKGADTKQVLEIEKALQHFRAIVLRDVGLDIGAMQHGGAAGGAAAGLHALVGAELRNGFDLVAELIEFDQKLFGADMLIVGEGELDHQSLRGKAAVAAARRAAAAGVEVRAIAGRVSLSADELSSAGISKSIDLTELFGDRAKNDSVAALGDAAKELVRD
ncbi:MAG TPA: glycerate kinase [Actinomycetota bacterium]|nr:glycerate kinase [Actinomycetota bacterium]